MSRLADTTRAEWAGPWPTCSPVTGSACAVQVKRGATWPRRASSSPGSARRDTAVTSDHTSTCGETVVNTWTIHLIAFVSTPIP